ncbi:MAG: hypothetical protein AUI83_07505 [Armatimonadetes bacterium 13_1_40CM_3_65_7]|nr:MAG: hypothetical protein AUI83_07505 [Armatimonadetes bacterium 13_1_40CM_3_65_7]
MAVAGDSAFVSVPEIPGGSRQVYQYSIGSNGLLRLSQIISFPYPGGALAADRQGRRLFSLGDLDLTVSVLSPASFFEVSAVARIGWLLVSLFLAVVVLALLFRKVIRRGSDDTIANETARD